MRPLLLLALAITVLGCSSTPPSAPPHEPGVHVELAMDDGDVQPPLFRWEAPFAARVTVYRGTGAQRTVVWEVAEGDRQGPDGRARRGPILPPLVYGTAFSPNAAGATPRVLVPPAPLQPRTVYSVTVISYDGSVHEGTFSVQERIDP